MFIFQSYSQLVSKISIKNKKDFREYENDNFIINSDDLLKHVITKRLYRDIIVISDKYLCVLQNVELILTLTLKISFVIIFN
jgi:hypothetical protein